MKYHLDNGGGPLDKNAITFHAGANNKKNSDLALTQAKIKVHGYNNHPYDFVPQIIGGNAPNFSTKMG